jgi:hypothetical protein
VDSVVRGVTVGLESLQFSWRLQTGTAKLPDFVVCEAQQRKSNCQCSVAFTAQALHLDELRQVPVTVGSHGKLRLPAHEEVQRRFCSQCSGLSSASGSQTRLQLVSLKLNQSQTHPSVSQSVSLACCLAAPCQLLSNANAQPWQAVYTCTQSSVYCFGIIIIPSTSESFRC